VVLLVMASPSVALVLMSCKDAACTSSGGHGMANAASLVGRKVRVDGTLVTAPRAGANSTRASTRFVIRKRNAELPVRLPCGRGRPILPRRAR